MGVENGGRATGRRSLRLEPDRGHRHSPVKVQRASPDANVIGYAYAALEEYDYMTLRGPAGILHDIIVEPEHRGRGVGRLLLEATLAHLRSRGAPRVVLSTAEQNEPAQRLFASMDFRRTMVEMTRELDR